MYAFLQELRNKGKTVNWADPHCTVETYEYNIVNSYVNSLATMVYNRLRNFYCTEWKLSSVSDWAFELQQFHKIQENLGTFN